VAGGHRDSLQRSDRGGSGAFVLGSNDDGWH
jgi:hypothetical protein